jgi:hypothetical protein
VARALTDLPGVSAVPAVPLALLSPGDSSHVQHDAVRDAPVPASAPSTADIVYASTSVPDPVDILALVHAPGSSVPSALSPIRTRLMDGIRKPKIFTDGTIRYANLTSSAEPYNVQEALSNPQWKAAMDDEYAALMRNKT